MNSEQFLWQRKNYTAPMPYLIAHSIYEYDIQKANISVLYALGIIDSAYYQRLYNADRMERQIEVGYLQRNNVGLADALAEGITEFRHKFFDANGLTELDILAIKNDAIFVIDKIPKVTQFGNVKFVQKNMYSSYIKLAKSIEVYFQSNRVTEQIIITVKGISDEKLELHQNGIVEVIANVLFLVESGDVNSALTYLTEFYNDFIDRRLDINYYREFNSRSEYVISANGEYYSIPNCNQSQVTSVNISCNLNILRELYKILSAIYFQRNRG